MIIKNIKTISFTTLALFALVILGASSVRADEIPQIETPAPDTTNVVIENSFALCHDGIDNDNGGTADLGDRNCANFLEVETENPGNSGPELICNDGIDNDNDGTADLGDRDCAVVEEPSNDTPALSSRRSGGSKKRVPTGNLSSGEVLGASTDAGSCKILTTYIKLGNDNNVEEVKMLQTFLNENLKISLPVTGFFGPLTFQAVKDFQLKYASDTLKPWVDLGLMANDDIGTGYVYKTTQYTINNMLCPDAKIVVPVLN